MGRDQKSKIINPKSEIQKVACPFCRSTDTEMIALFGMQMMTSQYYCRHCRSAFEAVKWEEPKSKATPARAGGARESQKSKSE